MSRRGIEPYVPDGPIEVPAPAGPGDTSLVESLALLVALGFRLEPRPDDPAVFLATLPLQWKVQGVDGPGDHHEPHGAILDRWGGRRASLAAREREVVWLGGPAEPPCTQRYGPYLHVHARYRMIWSESPEDPPGLGRWAVVDGRSQPGGGYFARLAYYSPPVPRAGMLSAIHEVACRRTLLCRHPRHADPLAYWEDDDDGFTPHPDD